MLIGLTIRYYGQFPSADTAAAAPAASEASATGGDPQSAEDPEKVRLVGAMVTAITTMKT